jgi:hypothetical protein
MKLRKSYLIIMLTLIFMTVFLMGCGNTQQGETTATPSRPSSLVIASGPIGGAFYPIAGGVATLVNQNVEGLNVNVQVTGGGVENARLIGTGQLDFGLVSADQANQGAGNYGVFEGENLKLEALGTLHSTVTKVVTLKRSNINTLEDLVGKRVAVGEPGGGAEVWFQRIVEVAGLDYEKDFNIINLPYEQAMDQMADGILDAAVLSSGLPAPSVTSLATRHDVSILSISMDIYNKFIEEYPTYVVIQAPVGTYTGVDNPVDVSAQLIQLVCRADLDPELGYEIAKAVYSNAEKLGDYHASAKSITLENAPKTAIKLNEGAERFYREAGVLD